MMIGLDKLKQLYLCIVLVLSAIYPSYSQNYPSSGASVFASKTITYLESHFREKVYIQADKNLYVAGDTVYFKAYVTLGECNVLSALSEVLHVQLINTKNKIERSLNLLLKHGMASGDFYLPKDLAGGNYHLKAYTQWMKNNGSASFFDRTVLVYALNKPVTNQLPNMLSGGDVDIRFLPEGGNLVDGIVSKVAFKAIGSNGLGREVKGEILDNQGNIAGRFSSTHLGMGFFLLKPESGKSYKAVLNLNSDTKKIFNLSAAAEQGVNLSVDNDSLPKATVKIMANDEFYLKNKGETFLLLVYDHGKITSVNCRMDSQVICLDILKRHLHSGVAIVTLFSPQGEPLCERRFFVQNYDGLSIGLTANKSNYSYGDPINLSLNVKNRADSAVAGYFSVSVVNENSLNNPEDADNISSYLLLSSDLKGYIEKPGYYFTDITDQKLKDLDLVMLTHGYSGFEWKDVDENKPATFAAEKGLEISGQLKNVLGNPVAKGTVTLIPNDGGTVMSASSDDKGFFNFKNLIFYDSTKFVLSAINTKGNNNIKLFYHKVNESFFIPQQNTQSSKFSSIGTNSSETAKNDYVEKQIAYQLSKNAIQLKEVQIKSVKLDNQYQTQSYAGAGNADQVMHADEIEKVGGMLTTSLAGRLRGVLFTGGTYGTPYLTINQNSLNGTHAMLVIIDGAEVPSEDINNLTADEVESVELLKYTSTAIYGMAGGSGVLVITTKQGGGLKMKDISPTGVLPITVNGFYIVRKFYSPKYEVDQPNLKTSLRSTIYWNPNIQTDLNGNASFSYYNLGLKGNYQVTVEGLDQEGNIGTKIIRYKIH